MLTIIIIAANSDVYFDETLFRLGQTNYFDHHRSVFALTKWHKRSKSLKDENDIYASRDLSLRLRIDSQDSWLFRVPISDHVINNSNFYIGAPRCDNVIATVFKDAGYIVENPAFAIRSIEIDERGRSSELYKSADVAIGRMSSWVLLSDKFVF